MGTKKNIAVIGGGISGLGACYLLKERASLTLFERNNYIGGHSRTLEVPVEGKGVPVDTGFIVYNRRNYPFLTQLFEALEVPVVKSDMSFGVSIDNGWLEYASNGWKGLFGNAKNLFRLNYWKMILDILKFNRQAHKYLDAPADFTLEMCLDELDMGDWFRRYYFLPMGGSIWSCPVDQMLNFPASSLLRFFQNHGLLTVRDHPQWYSVLGGSREYVSRLLKAIGPDLEVVSGATLVSRNSDDNSVSVIDSDGTARRFDEVIIATHPDEALQLLQNPSPLEQELLTAFRYQPNEVVLHTDKSFMPNRKTAWASWVYRSQGRVDKSPAVSLSYWMNNLQKLPTDVPIFVTLNPSSGPEEGSVINRHRFDHPVFDERAITAQQRFMEIQGRDRIWYCGAYQRNGFHEDGLWSAVRVATEMGIEVSW